MDLPNVTSFGNLYVNKDNLNYCLEQLNFFVP